MGAAGVVLALGVTQWVVTAREDAAVARLARLPGVVSPVDDTLEVVRRLTPGDAVTLTGRASGTLLRADDGSQTYRWFEPASERTGWTTQLLGPTALPADPSQVAGVSTCEPDDDQRRVVCVVTDGARVMDGTGRIDELPATTRELVVLDTADGSVVSRTPIERGTALAVLPGDVAVVGALTDELVEITAYDTRTGRERWTHEQPWRPGGGDLDVFRANDLVAFSAPDHRLTLLSSDGAVVRSGIELDYLGDPGLGLRLGWQLDPRDGTLVVTGQGSDGLARSTFLAADGDPDLDVTVTGQPVPVGVDDGSVPRMLLTGDNAVHAWDAQTGALRWSADVRSTTSALVLRGRVILTTDRGVVAIDGRSGRVLWRSDELVGLTPSALLTDGAHVLVATERTGVGAAPALLAYDPADGAEAFRAPYPAGVVELGALGRTLVGRDAASDERVQLG